MVVLFFLVDPCDDPCVSSSLSDVVDAEARRLDVFRGGAAPGDADGGAATGAPLSLDLPATGSAVRDSDGAILDRDAELETP